MSNNTTSGCAVIFGLFIGIVFISWALTVGLIWLICLCFSPFGVVFDLGIATGVWLILALLSCFIGGKE